MIKTKMRHCPVCSISFIVGKYGQKYCSEECEKLGIEKELIEKKAKDISNERYIGVNRFTIFKRDNFKCIYCGLSSIEDEIKLHIDHIRPISKEGTSEINNLITSCARCNIAKSNYVSEELIKRITKIAKDRNKKHNLSN